MTIARDLPSETGSRSKGAGTRVPSGAGVPLELRVDRLDRQIASFVRAGYRLETRAGLQAIVMGPRRHRLPRDGAVRTPVARLRHAARAVLGRAAGHRVVITVGASGQVRLA